jgi:hypothetical protein
MKIFGFTLFAAALVFAAPVAAQNMPDVPPNPAIRQAFDQMRSQMQTVRRTERSQMLGALTSAHRTLLATIAGELATAVEPNYDAAAKRLNAALSSAESQAVLRVAQNAREERRKVMESMIPPPPPGGGQRVTRREFRAPGPVADDAGRVLLRTMIGGGPGMGIGPMVMMRGGFDMEP